MTKLKICGLMSAQDAQYANAVRPDHAGMILSAGFRRSISAETAREIRAALDGSIPTVGVFVNAQIAEIAAYAERGIIQMVQLHGAETAAFIRDLRTVCTLPIIQAFRIAEQADVQRAAQSDADVVLLDSGTGTGKPFDHTLLKGFPRPYFLAGGLSPENAAALIAQHKPYGVDVSSGVETDGRKDLTKMLAFADAVRGTHD